MSDNHYRIDVSQKADGEAEATFYKVDAEGTPSRLTEPHSVRSDDGLIDALQGLLNDLENAEVEVFSDDEDERTAALENVRFVNGMIFAKGAGGPLYVRTGIGGGLSRWQTVEAGQGNIDDDTIAQWDDLWVDAQIVFDPRT